MNELNLVTMARELLSIHENISAYVKNPTKTRVSDFELETFVQMWGNTSGGFGGFGGSAMTSQRTYVFIPMYDDGEKCLVFFGDRFAYKADYCEKFRDDLNKRQISGVAGSGKYIDMKGEL